MFFIIVLILFLLFYKSKIYIHGFNDNYMDRNNTLYIKGLFTILVFFRHCNTFISLESLIDLPMKALNGALFQNIVAMFLFYSGYGIYEKIKIDKEKYIKNFPIKRFLSTYLNFFVAVISFLIMDIVLNQEYSLKTIFLSFIGWKSIGNSNWYMFAIFIQYIFVIIAFNFIKKDNKKALYLIVLLTIIYSFVVLKFQAQEWMSTIFCFELGMFYSLYKDKIDNVLMNNKNYILIRAIVSVIYFGLTIVYYFTSSSLVHVGLSLDFTVLVVMFTMKINNNSKVLSFLGNNLFYIYIMQRLPMIVLKDIGINKDPYIFFVSSFAITIIIAVVYNNVFGKNINKMINNCLKNNKKIEKNN